MPQTIQPVDQGATTVHSSQTAQAIQPSIVVWTDCSRLSFKDLYNQELVGTEVTYLLIMVMNPKQISLFSVSFDKL